jgi:hypothetical protein
MLLRVDLSHAPLPTARITLSDIFRQTLEEVGIGYPLRGLKSFMKQEKFWAKFLRQIPTV